MNPAVVRAVEPGDVADLAVLHTSTWQFAYRGVLPDAFLDGLSVDDSRQRWEGILAAPGQASTVVAVVDGALAGFVSFGPSGDDPNWGELMALYVTPRSWGTGVGHLLHDHARECLAERYPCAALWVLGGNDRACGFYERHGWEPDGRARVERRPGGVELHEIRYILRVSSPRGHGRTR